MTGAPARATTVSAVALALVAACGGSSTPAATSQAATQQPRTEAQVRTVAQQEYAAYAAGKWDQAWDFWTAEGKQAFSQADYVKLRSTCPPPPSGFTVQGVVLNGDRASVRTEHAGAVFSSEFVYQGGAWRYQPPAANLADYRAGVDSVIAKEKSAGTC